MQAVRRPSPMCSSSTGGTGVNLMFTFLPSVDMSLSAALIAGGTSPRRKASTADAAPASSWNTKVASKAEDRLDRQA